MSEKKVIGIRGLDLSVYEQIQGLARKKNENVADIINEALKKYLSDDTELEYIAPQNVSGLTRFELTKEALIQLNPLRIEDVDTLIVIDDEEEITQELIEENLDSVTRVQEIQTPKRLYYIFLKKAKNIGQINYYEGKWREEKLLRFFSSTKLTAAILERFKRDNFKINIIVTSGDLFLSPDIPLALFEDVVSSIMVKGNLAVSDELYASLLTIGTIEGVIQLIDKDGNPIEQIQYEKDFFTTGDDKSSTTGKRKGKAPSLAMNFSPGFETLLESIEEIKDGFKSVFSNLDINEEIKSQMDRDTTKKTKKKRDRVKPTKKD